MSWNCVINKVKTFIFIAFFLVWSCDALAFSCRTSAGATIPVGGGSANVYVNLSPQVQPGQNLVVDLSSQIFCKNDSWGDIVDFVSVREGSSYGGALANFEGTLKYNGESYIFPTNSETPAYAFKNLYYSPWPLLLYLKQIGSAGGVVINAGSKFAVIKLHQTNNRNSDSYFFTWNIFSNNNVVVPTGGCDVSSRNVTITLPDYPGTAAVPLTVHCGQNQQLAYYLTGTTADTASTIFTNTSSSNPATGLGVQLSNPNGVVATNKNVSLGIVGTSPVSLSLTASYARTTGQVVAGNVQSIIGVTFVYE